MSTVSVPRLDRTAPHPSDVSGNDPVGPVIERVPDLEWTEGEWVEVERVRLATVVRLDDHRPRPLPTPRHVYLRRRLGALLAVLAVALFLALTAGGGLADAGPDDPVAGQAVVEPGETLWDVAVANAPAGIDARSYLDRIRELNGLSGDVPAWTVVLLPHA